MKVNSKQTIIISIRERPLQEERYHLSVFLRWDILLISSFSSKLFHTASFFSISDILIWYGTTQKPSILPWKIIYIYTWTFTFFHFLSLCLVFTKSAYWRASWRVKISLASISSIRFAIRHVSSVQSSIRAVITFSTGGLSGSWQVGSVATSVMF